MAGVNKMEVRVREMATLAVVVLLMMAVTVVARPGKLKDSCSASNEYVFPYWSLCTSPAELSTGYNYYIISYYGGALAPEYDETNATYYVRLADSAATYVAVTKSSESSALLVNSTVYIYNIESKRALAWRQEGTDEYFLIEQEVSSVTGGAAFRFQLAEAVTLPCPLIYPPAQCHAYYLISYPGASSSSDTSGVGLLAYEEDEGTYIKAASEGSTGDLPLTVRQTSSSSITTSAMPFPTIRSVTAPRE